MCITKIINSIFFNYFKSGYRNILRSNFLICEKNLYTIKVDSMSTLKLSFSKLTKALHTNNTVCESYKKKQILYLEEKPKELNIYINK